MPIISSPRCTLLLLTTFGMLPASFIVHADTVILSDGFTLKGKVQKEGEVLVDPGSGQAIWTPKLRGFFVVDDYARRMFFSQRNALRADDESGDVKKTASYVYQFTPALRHYTSTPAPNFVRVESAAPWQANGEREIKLNVGTNTVDAVQCITTIDPHFIRASTRSWRWYCSYLTNEFEPSIVLAMIRHNLEQRKLKGDPKLPKNRKPPMTLDEEMQLYRFCIRAGWFVEAEQQLTGIVAGFPDEKAKLEVEFAELRKLQAKRRLEAIDLAFKVGQHQRAQQLLGELPEEGAVESVKERVRVLRKQYQDWQGRLEATRGYLAAVQKEAESGATLPPALRLALAEIERDLNFDTLPRLEPFFKYTAQEERFKAQGKPPQYRPEQLLAFAVSGWIEGADAAEANVTSVLKLWSARQWLLQYLQTDSSIQRDEKVEQFLKGEALPVNVMEQLIDLLPPPAADANIPKGPAEFTTLLNGEKGTTYRVQLPPDYHPHRPYPVLLVLPTLHEDLKETLTKWTPYAQKHGYILAAPAWAGLTQTEYNSSEKEHQAVTATIRDLRRRFNVDSERVFLAGWNVGGMMAYDVGMSHPDMFAGVVVMCGRPGKIFRNYKYNAQYLPFYVVSGERSREDFIGEKEPRENRQLFEFWIPQGFPSLYTEYTGRGFEFFEGELPYIFDWLSRKKRVSGKMELGMANPQAGGQAFEFRSVRPSDNRFYWLTSDAIHPPAGGAKLAARIAGPNLIIANVFSVRQLSVWLNAAMVDLQQPVEIRVNPGAATAKTFKKELKPSLKVLLDDFYIRGDKKNLFVTRVDFQW